MICKHPNLFLALSLQQLRLFLSALLGTLFIALSLSYSSSLHAIDELQSSGSPFAVSEEAFLHVDEAYQLNVRQTDTEIIAEWMIADKYFLYGEQFRFNMDGQSLTSSRPKGKIAYDEFFEKDVEKIYVYNKATINQEQLPTNNQANTLTITYQGCADAGLCYPPVTKQFSINPTSITPINTTTNRFGNVSPANNTPSNFDNPNTLTTTNIVVMIVFALFGGMLLNLMPCVFPVLSIKALSLVNQTDRRARIKHGWSYTAGCLAMFIIVAIALFAVRSAGKSVGWGFQLQEPAIITTLAFLFLIMGLSLSGLVHFGSSWMNTGQSLTQSSGHSHSFFTGVLAAVVASPCTAPLMASALGYALTQPPFVALCIFGALGLGMALPFLILSYSPQLGKYLPKPGAWMDTFKQALAFPLYITSAWLLWILGHQAGNNAVILVILGAIGIVFILWVNQKRPQWKTSTYTLGAILLANIVWQNKQPSVNDDHLWETYTANRLTQLRQENQAVFINLTADWCITCKINERIVFTPSTLQRMKDNNIHLMEGDWTQYNPEITQLLNTYKRAGVPLYLFFPAKSGAKAEILPQILTPSNINELIRRT